VEVASIKDKHCTAKYVTREETIAAHENGPDAKNSSCQTYKRLNQGRLWRLKTAPSPFSSKMKGAVLSAHRGSQPSFSCNADVCQSTSTFVSKVGQRIRQI
jgi:hypothetical protein